MLEYRDGTFGDPVPVSDEYKKLFDEMAEAGDDLKAVHFGTEEELLELKRQWVAEGKRPPADPKLTDDG